jgi:kynureninase
MPNQFDPIPTAEGWQVSNPPIFSLAAIRAALAVFDEAGGVSALRRKSVRLTGYLIDLLDAELSDVVQILTPREPGGRGCQLSLRSMSSIKCRELHRRLTAQGVATDCREPDVLRAAPVPLYNSYLDVWRFVEALRHAVRGAW